jgi:hypothetical protein
VIFSFLLRLNYARFLTIFPPFLQEAAHPGEEVSEFSAWAMSHMGRASPSVSFDPAAPPEVYSDPNVYTKVQEYTSAVREIHGEDYNVRTEPIDAEAIMRLGGGKKHGRLWIADGAIDPSTVRNLDAIRARSTSSSQAIRPRPTPALQQVEALQVMDIVCSFLHTKITSRLLIYWSEIL